MFAPTKTPTGRRRGILTAVVKVEKDRFAGVVDPRIGAVTVTMAISRGQIGEGFDRLCGPRNDVFKVAADVGVFHDAAIVYPGKRPMQQVFEVEPIELSIRLEYLGGIVHQSKRLAVGSRIAGIHRIRPSAVDRPKEHGLAQALRRNSVNEQAALACRDGCCDRNARLRKMRQERRFGPDVGRATGAAMGKPEHIPLAAACNGKIHIIQAALEHSAGNRPCKRIVPIDELFDSRNLRRRIERIKIEHRRCTIGLCWQAASAVKNHEGGGGRRHV